MRHLKDWSLPEDVAYAREKYEALGFDFKAAEEDAESAGKEMEELLKELDELLLSDTSFCADGVLGKHDVEILPELRTLTCAHGLKWPLKLKRYVVNSFAQASAETYF